METNFVVIIIFPVGFIIILIMGLLCMYFSCHTKSPVRESLGELTVVRVFDRERKGSCIPVAMITPSPALARRRHTIDVVAENLAMIASF